MVHLLTLARLSMRSFSVGGARKMRRVLRIVSFLICLGLMLSGLNFVTSYKFGDGIVQPQLVERLPVQSCDVMFFGSSRVFENIDTGQLWDTWGIAAFNSCGSVQPLWNTYFYMKQAFERQHPRVVVVEVYRAVETRDYLDESRVIKNTFSLPLHLELPAKRVSAPANQVVDYELEFPFSHTRVEELVREDFLPNKGAQRWKDWKGFSANFTSGTYEKPDPSSVTSRTPMSQKSEKYLKMIVDLCEEEGVPLVFICAPYPVSDEEQSVYNYVADFAEERGIPFINYNLMYDNLGIDFSTDFASDQHLNYRGAKKFTAALGEYLVSNYDLPDRRGEEGYESWERDAADIRARARDAELGGIKSPSALISASLEGENAENMVVIVSGYQVNESIPEWRDVAATLETYGTTVDSSGLSAVIDGGDLVFQSTSPTYEWHGKIGSTYAMVSRSGGKTPETRFPTSSVEVPSGCLTVFVYDRLTDQTVSMSTWRLAVDGVQRIG